VQAFLDEEAASALRHRDYYDFAVANADRLSS
jgi:hypothetical protein